MDPGAPGAAWSVTLTQLGNPLPSVTDPLDVIIGPTSCPMPPGSEDDASDDYDPPDEQYWERWRRIWMKFGGGDPLEPPAAPAAKKIPKQPAASSQPVIDLTNESEQSSLQPAASQLAIPNKKWRPPAHPLHLA